MSAQRLSLKILSIGAFWPFIVHVYIAFKNGQIQPADISQALISYSACLTKRDYWFTKVK